MRTKLISSPESAEVVAPSLRAGELFAAVGTTTPANGPILKTPSAFNNHQTQSFTRFIRHRRLGAIFLTLLAIILLGIYIPRIFAYDYWSDECYSILLSHMGFREMLAATAGDVHPPFFYAVLMVLYRIFGDQAWAYGVAPLIPYGGTLLLCLTFVRRKFGTSAAACTMLCCAFMQNAITYNVELRMYSWTAFFIFASFCLLYNCLEKRSLSTHIALGACCALASYSHYYGFLAAGLILFALMVIALLRRQVVINMLVACVTALVLYLPWLLVLISTFQRSTDSFWLQDIPSLLTCLLFPFQIGHGSLIGLALLAIFFILFVITLLFAQRARYSHLREHTHRNGKASYESPAAETSRQADDGVLCTWLIVGMFVWLGTILVGLTLSYAVRPFLITRYLFPTAPIAWIMLAVMASQHFTKPYLVWGITLAIALTGAPSYVQSAQSFISRYGLHEQTLSKLEETIEPGDVLLTNTYALDWTVLSVYFPNNTNESFSFENAPRLAPDTTYWLLLENPESLTDANKVLEQQGHHAVDANVSGILVKYSINLYKIEPIG